MQWTWFDDFVISSLLFFNDDKVDDHDNYLYFELNVFVVVAVVWSMDVHV